MAAVRAVKPLLFTTLFTVLFTVYLASVINFSFLPDRDDALGTF